jgi:hypothetical protein
MPRLYFISSNWTHAIPKGGNPEKIFELQKKYKKRNIDF